MKLKLIGFFIWLDVVYERMERDIEGIWRDIRVDIKLRKCER